MMPTRSAVEAIGSSVGGSPTVATLTTPPFCCASAGMAPSASAPASITTLWNPMALSPYRSLSETCPDGGGTRLRSQLERTAFRRLSALDGAGGQARHDLPLRDDRQDQHREGHDERGGGKWSPAQLLEREHVVDRDRQGPRLAPGEHDAEDEII